MSKLIGDRIYSLRKKLGLSQEEFANRIGVSRQVVSKWEMNQVIPLIDKLKKIYKFIKENKYADFRLMMDNNQTNTISAELNEYGALVTIKCRITELENTQV